MCMSAGDAVAHSVVGNTGGSAGSGGFTGGAGGGGGWALPPPPPPPQAHSARHPARSKLEVRNALYIRSDTPHGRRQQTGGQRVEKIERSIPRRRTPGTDDSYSAIPTVNAASYPPIETLSAI